MKIGTLKNNSRDGALVVVSRDLKRMQSVKEVCTLQQAIDNWVVFSPILEIIYSQLNQDSEFGEVFDAQCVSSPFPRAYQWLDGSAYVNHIELVRRARGAKMPENFWLDPLMYQGLSDTFLGPCDPIIMKEEEWGIDFEAEIAVITDDVPMGVTEELAFSHIKLIMLVNDISLRNLIPNELAKGFGFINGKPASSFSPVAITPDELGIYWNNSKVNLPLSTYLNGKIFGSPDTGKDMTFNFSQLITHAAKTRSLSAGTIIGSGTISNRDRSLGCSCIVEKRMEEILEKGIASTPFLKNGDRVFIEMLDKTGSSLFGSIDQVVKIEKNS